MNLKWILTIGLLFYRIPHLIVLRESLLQGVDANLIRAIISVESNWNANAIAEESNVNDFSYGLMQIRKDTADFLGFTGEAGELLNPSLNIRLGVKYLKRQLLRYNNQTDWAIAAYNAGTASKRGNQFTNQTYVDKVLARMV
ncbi:lytic transglycosylase domain-containing protein [Candidatus Poribacteria bacterium]|nr:lytic transglycosylase domain-containing protein [Candidatus Poribacteria bacterium]